MNLSPKVINLADYTKPNFEVNNVYLDFQLDKTNTIVKNTMQISRLSEGSLVLNGENIDLISVKINNQLLKKEQYRVTNSKLIINDTPNKFSLEIINTINPSINNALMGLYISDNKFCTQCEAEGFRRVTYYLDRPDVLSKFKVKITANKNDYPYLLANGNMTESGELPKSQHFAVWDDPFPKPAYLFALVAGKFDVLESSFTTMNKRKVLLSIFVDPGLQHQAEFAMRSLKMAMKWDEDNFGREYDLDRFMIVAIRDFNFGAMENKGLNIFNSSLLLADEETTTDLNYERIESIVAHEYFHNWTGNRITCRDWFQLCLKEGFTVFRDQEFSADMRGTSVQRIKDVKRLRKFQFSEDAGPLSHAVRPDSYIKIDNFYTSTVYEKGAEIVRMLKTLLGADHFRAGCDLYFKKLDGLAVTIEDFINCFEEASGKNLDQFLLWYKQSGTPQVHVSYAKNKDKLELDFNQILATNSTGKKKKAQVIPIKWQIIGNEGPISKQRLTIINSLTKTVSIKYPDKDFSISILQDFSAPINLHFEQNIDDTLRLMESDENDFNRWESGQIISRTLISNAAKLIAHNNSPDPGKPLECYTTAIKNSLNNNNLSNAFKTLVLTIPNQNEILNANAKLNPIAVQLACNWLNKEIANSSREELIETYLRLYKNSPAKEGMSSISDRALKNICLFLLSSRHDAFTKDLAIKQFHEATNMTDELSSLQSLDTLDQELADDAIHLFYNKWKNNPLVLDKWFSLQASRNHKRGLSAIKELTQHESFEITNPNRVRAVLGGFSVENTFIFHNEDGTGYEFFIDQVLKVDRVNPSVASRLLGVFEVVEKLDDHRQNKIKSLLKTIIHANPSNNILEITMKILK